MQGLCSDLHDIITHICPLRYHSVVFLLLQLQKLHSNFDMENVKFIHEIKKFKNGCVIIKDLTGGCDFKKLLSF